MEISVKRAECHSDVPEALKNIFIKTRDFFFVPEDRNGTCAQRLFRRFYYDTELPMDVSWNRGLLEAALQNAGVGLMVQNRDRRIIAINRAFEEVTGWRSEDILGRGCDAVFRCHTSTGKCIVDKACPGMQVINEEVSRIARELLIQRNDGSECWVEVTVFPVKGAEGNVEHIVSTFQDISEKRKYFEEILRTKTLASLGQLSAELAHEVKNPLNAIHIQMLLLEKEISLRTELAGGEVPAVVSRVKEEVVRLNELLENCLKFSRSGDLVLKLMDAGPILEELVTLVAPQAGLSGISVTLNVERGLPPVVVDKEKLKQAVLNLVLNSIEAMPDGGALTITAVRDGDMVKIICRDTGPGIPEGVKDDIFKLFYTTKKDGSGIGLPLAHNIIQSHGGSLSCTSSDKGTEFIIKLPLDNVT